MVPGLKIFAVLREGFYDILKKRIVKKIINISETHIVDDGSFSTKIDLIHKNYDALDMDFTDMIVLQLSMPHRLKKSTFFYAISKADGLTLNKTMDVLLSIKEGRQFDEIFSERGYDVVDFERQMQAWILFRLENTIDNLSLNLRVLKNWTECQNNESSLKNLSISPRTHKVDDKLKEMVDSYRSERDVAFHDELRMSYERQQQSTDNLQPTLGFNLARNNDSVIEASRKLMSGIQSGQYNYNPESIPRDDFRLRLDFLDSHPIYSQSTQKPTHEITELRKYNQKLEKDVELLRHELLANVNFIQGSKKRESSLSQKNKFLEEQLILLKKEFDVIKHQSQKDGSNKSDRTMFLERKVDELLDTNDSLRMELEELREKTRGAIGTSETKEHIIISLKEDTEVLREKVEYFKSQYDRNQSDLQAHIKSLDDMKRSKEATLLENRNLKSEVESLKSDINAFEEDIQSNYENMQKMIDENKILSEEKEELASRIVEMEKFIEELQEAQSKELEEGQQEMNSLLGRIAELEEDKTTGQNILEQMKQGIDELEQNALKYKKKYKKVKKQNSKLVKEFIKLDKKMETVVCGSKRYAKDSDDNDDEDDFYNNYCWDI